MHARTYFPLVWCSNLAMGGHTRRSDSPKRFRPLEPPTPSIQPQVSRSDELTHMESNSYIKSMGRSHAPKTRGRPQEKIQVTPGTRERI
jgi:hypothetical protein